MRLRLIIHPPMDPRLNMALDEALLNSRIASGEDTLRVYAWMPWAVSLGRRQDPWSAVRLGAAARAGVLVVRRPTGGLALIHGLGVDLTYSVVVGGELASIPVDESAARIAEGVAAALRALGLPARVGPVEGLPGDPVVCMLNPGASDVSVQGRKVSGSAQTRRRGVALQHGSVLLRLDAGLWLRLLKGRAGRSELEGHVAGIWDLGAHAGLDEVAWALAEGIAGTLGARVEPGTLTAWEAGEAVRLLYSKYSMPGWSHPAGGLPPTPWVSRRQSGPGR